MRVSRVMGHGSSVTSMSVPPSPESSDAEQGPQLSRGARKGWWWGWLYSEQQQKLCHLKPDTATVHAQWVAIRTYGYGPPRPPVPITRRRTLRYNAIEAWQTMQKMGWRRCPPLVR